MQPNSARGWSNATRARVDGGAKAALDRYRKPGHARTWRWVAIAALVATATLALPTNAVGEGSPAKVAPGPHAWKERATGMVRGITVGPIESALHPGRGYGSEACDRTMREANRLGATWVSITPFGRVWDLESVGVDPTFEAPFEDNKRAVERAIEQAHRAGLKVLLVPHLWVETGGWRALIDPKTDAGWERWAASYREFLLSWARVARDNDVEMLSVGVELRSWVTTTRAPSFSAIIEDVRNIYPGLLTYAANWDDVHQTVILGDLDVIGINAFYPLTDVERASLGQLVQGGTNVAKKLRDLSHAWQKPILFTEIGYTTRPDPALKPWEWPDHMTDVVVDEAAQADAYWGLLAPLVDEEWFAGFFVWRMYADPDDMSQEAEWGFSPRGKEAELVLRDAFQAHWASDGERPLDSAIVSETATRVGVY